MLVAWSPRQMPICFAFPTLEAIFGPFLIFHLEQDGLLAAAWKSLGLVRKGQRDPQRWIWPQRLPPSSPILLSRWLIDSPLCLRAQAGRWSMKPPGPPIWTHSTAGEQESHLYMQFKLGYMYE